VPMLSAGSSDTWYDCVHAMAFLPIIAMGVLAPLRMALAVRGNAKLAADPSRVSALLCITHPRFPQRGSASLRPGLKEASHSGQ
jgi:hypothetical protein